MPQALVCSSDARLWPCVFNAPCQGDQQDLGSERQPPVTRVIKFTAEHRPGQEIHLQEASLGLAGGIRAARKPLLVSAGGVWLGL